MKKILIIVMILALLILPACADNGESTELVDPSISVENRNIETNENPDDFTVNRLTMNIFLLEGTDYAVTSEQAGDMLYLWQVAKSLIESSTAADEELNAVTNQIGALLTNEQLEYLLTVDYEQVNMNVLLAEYGFLASKPGLDGSVEKLPGTTGDDLGIVGGGQGKGAGQGLGDQDLSPEEIATKEAMRAEFGGAGFGMNTMSIDAVIEFLESKIQ